MITRPLTIPQLDALTANAKLRREKLKRLQQDQIREGVNRLNEILIQYWDQAGPGYLPVEKAFIYPAPVFQEIRRRFLENRIAIRYNPTQLSNGARVLEFRIVPEE